jgi:hypothetical protein
MAKKLTPDQIVMLIGILDDKIEALEEEQDENEDDDVVTTALNNTYDLRIAVADIFGY